MNYNIEKFSFCLSICIARHMARIYGENQARAITRAARRLRDQTRDQQVYELAKFYTRDIDPKVINGKRVTGDEAKVYSVQRVEHDMKMVGLL